MSDQDNHDQLPENGRAPKRPRLDADKGREPELISGQLGSRWISLNALVERIESTFVEEHGDDSPELLEADTSTKRLKLVLATVDYVLAVESVQVSMEEKADIINRVYSNLFGYGPLDALFLDERVTTISLDGADKASVRYGHGELQSLGPIFQSEDHLRRTVKRLLMDAGAELRDDQPYIEVGLLVDERPICVNLVAPPISYQLGLDIRVHPKALPAAGDLIMAGFMTSQAVELLKAIVQSSHGLLIVGDPESGKTTLLSVLSRWLPDPEKVVAVERANELRLPPGVTRLATKWPVGGQQPVSFGEQIGHALEQKSACLLLDEVRSDEPQTISPLLQMPDAPRQLWSFRGTIFAKRLQSALGMLARRADVEQGEDLVQALYRRLPFVIAVNRVNSALRLWSIGEWQFKHSADYPTYTLLMHTENGELKLTGEHPLQELNLSRGFWETA
jgi:Flp pilus assembly CpaF family ATPase